MKKKIRSVSGKVVGKEHNAVPNPATFIWLVYKIKSIKIRNSLIAANKAWINIPNIFNKVLKSLKWFYVSRDWNNQTITETFCCLRESYAISQSLCVNHPESQSQPKANTTIPTVLFCLVSRNGLLIYFEALPNHFNITDTTTWVHNGRAQSISHIRKFSVKTETWSIFRFLW